MQQPKVNVGVYGSPSIMETTESVNPADVWMGADGVLLAGYKGDDFNTAPVREVFHLRTHPLVIVVTDLDVYVMTSEEYSQQV